MKEGTRSDKESEVMFVCDWERKRSKQTITHAKSGEGVQGNSARRKII